VARLCDLLDPSSRTSRQVTECRRLSDIWSLGLPSNDRLVWDGLVGVAGDRGTYGVEINATEIQACSTEVGCPSDSEFRSQIPLASFFPRTGAPRAEKIVRSHHVNRSPLKLPFRSDFHAGRQSGSKTLIRKDLVARINGRDPQANLRACPAVEINKGKIVDSVVVEIQV
jgi:hypothetical protein